MIKILSVLLLLFSLFIGVSGVCMLVLGPATGVESDTSFLSLINIVFMFGVAFQSIYVLRYFFGPIKRTQEQPQSFAGGTKTEPPIAGSEFES